jgi:hypothetical protein
MIEQDLGIDGVRESVLCGWRRYPSSSDCTMNHLVTQAHTSPVVAITERRARWPLPCTAAADAELHFALVY